jgi:hypothetical protein
MRTKAIYSEFAGERKSARHLCLGINSKASRGAGKLHSRKKGMLQVGPDLRL